MYSSPIRSDVLLDYQWDEYALNVMHVLTVADTPKDIEVLIVKGSPPELEIPEIDYPNTFARVPALWNPKTGSYAKGAADSIADDFGYISAPTPDGKAVLVDVYLDQVLSLDQLGNKYARWSLPAGTFAKLISASSDLDSLWLLYWESTDENDNNLFRFEQRLLSDGSLVEYEVTDGMQSEVTFDRETYFVHSLLVIDEWFAVLGDIFLDINNAIASDAEIDEITSHTVNGDGEIIESSEAVGSATALDIIIGSPYSPYVESNCILEVSPDPEYIFVGLSGSIVLADLSRNVILSLVDCPGTPGSDGLSGDCEIIGIEVHAWSTTVARNGHQYYQTSETQKWDYVGEPDVFPPYTGPYGQELFDYDLLDIHGEWSPMTDPTIYPMATGSGYFPESISIPGLDRHILYGDEQSFDPEFTGAIQAERDAHPQTRLITSPVIQASESHLYIINTVKRQFLNLRDTTKVEGDVDRRTTRSVLYRFDKSTRSPKVGVKPVIVSMSCAYGRAATDALGLVMADTFFPAEYSETYPGTLHLIGTTLQEKIYPVDHMFREGDMLIFDENFNLTYDEPMAFPLMKNSYQNYMHVMTLTEEDCPHSVFPCTGDTVSQTIRQSSTLLANGGYIVTAACVEARGAYLYSGIDYQMKEVPVRVRFKVYGPDKNFHYVMGGRQGTLLGYSIQGFCNYIQSDTPLVPEDMFYFVLSDVGIETFGISMLNSYATIQLDEAVSSDVYIDTTFGISSEVTLGFIGYREIQCIITNTSPVCTLNREPLSRFSNMTYYPVKEEQPGWADLDEVTVYDTNFKNKGSMNDCAIGCYPSFTTFWTRGEIRKLQEDGTYPFGTGWLCEEESAIIEASQISARDLLDSEYNDLTKVTSDIPLPVQYAIDSGYGIFGFFRPADGETAQQTRTKGTFLDGSEEDVAEAFPCSEFWPQDYEGKPWYYVYAIGQWYTMGCRLYKFRAPNTIPYSMYELQDQYTDQSGVQQFFTYRHFGLNTNQKEIYVIRCSGKHNIFSLPTYYGGDTEYMRFNFQVYVEVPTWADFYECSGVSLGGKAVYPTIVEEIEFEDNDYTNRDIVVLDYDFSIKYSIGVSAIEGLQDDDVIQHAIGKDGYIFIFTQVKETIPFSWKTIFSDWFLEDPDLLKKYGHMETYVTYRKSRVYAIRGTLKTGIAKLLHEFNTSTFGQDNIVIQEVTDTHVWLNWDGIRQFMRGPISGVGVRLDGTGIDEVPGLVAVVKDVYRSGWQLLMYPRTEDSPTNIISDVYATSLSSFYPEYEGKARQNTYWGNLVSELCPSGEGPTAVAPGRGYYMSHLKVLDEHTLEQIGWDGSMITNGPLDTFGVSYRMKPACQPAVSQFFVQRLYDWVSSDVTLKGETLINAPVTWISVNNGTTGVLVL